MVATHARKLADLFMVCTRNVADRVDLQNSYITSVKSLQTLICKIAVIWRRYKRLTFGATISTQNILIFGLVD